MKLAPVTFSIVHSGAGSAAGIHCGRSNPIILPRSNCVRPLWVRRCSGNLIAHSHVSRQNGRLECHWSLDGEPADYQLWRKPHRIMPRRPGLPQWRLHRRCHKPVTKPMSFRFDGPASVSLQRESFPA